MFAKLKHDLTILSSSEFRLLAIVGLVSGAGNALIPIAFAIETIRVEPRGWGMASVLIALWLGRFIGLLLCKKYGHAFDPIKTMIVAVISMGIAQIGLLLWIVTISISISAMSMSSFFYGIAAAFFGPSLFVTIPLITSSDTRTQANSILSIIGDMYPTFRMFLTVLFSIFNSQKIRFFSL